MWWATDMAGNTGKEGLTREAGGSPVTNVAGFRRSEPQATPERFPEKKVK